MEDELPVDQAIFFHVTGLAEEDVGFGLFVRQGGGGGAVGEAAV